MKHLLISMAALLAVLAGCGSDPAGPVIPADYFPLSVGSEWEYDVVGTVNIPPGFQYQATGTLTREIAGQVQHSGGFQVFFVISEQELQLTDSTGFLPDTSISFVDSIWLRKTESEVLVYYDADSTDHELYLELPLQTGNTWTPDDEAPEVTKTVESLSADFTAMGHTYSCASILESDTSEPDYYWREYLADGIGVVGIEIGDTDSLTQVSTTITATLEHFTIN